LLGYLTGKVYQVRHSCETIAGNGDRQQVVNAMLTPIQRPRRHNEQ